MPTSDAGRPGEAGPRIRPPSSPRTEAPNAARAEEPSWGEGRYQGAGAAPRGILPPPGWRLPIVFSYGKRGTVECIFAEQRSVVYELLLERLLDRLRSGED